jgi:gentisate 1,2-dioxygenase
VSTLDQLYETADKLNLTPAWIRRETPIMRRELHSRFLPAHWHYDQIREVLDAAGRLVDVSLSERRNFALRNPADDFYRTMNTMVCAYQMILPGETAPSHRHSSHALRVILDSQGSFSVVNGEKTPMETGDVVLTPGWYWHGHGHDGDSPAYWLDGLDIPLTNLLEPMADEDHPDRYEKIVSVVTASRFRFPREVIAKRLDETRPDPEGFHGRRVQLEAPDMPTMGLFVERLESGSSSRRQRSTVNHVFVVMEGRGESVVEDSRFVWQRGDAFVVPMWNRFEHTAKSDSVLFVLSDEPLIRFARYYRFEAD